MTPLTGEVGNPELFMVIKFQLYLVGSTNLLCDIVATVNTVLLRA